MSAGNQLQPPLRALPALLIAASFASGIGAAMLLESCHAGLLTGVICASAGLIVTLIRKFRKAGLLLIVAGAGAVDYTLSTGPIVIPDGERIYSGVTEQVFAGDSRMAAVVKIDSIDGHRVHTMKVRLTLEQSNDEVNEGYRITFIASLHSNADTAAVPDEITYGDILNRSNIKATAFLRKDNMISLREAEGLQPLMSRLRRKITEIIYRSSLNTDSKQFIATALLGQRNALSSETREAFAIAGLSHILALSGMHLAIIAAMFYWLSAPFLIFVSRHVRSVIIIVMVWGYAFLTGLGAPVVRAAIMTSLVICADILQRRTFALNSLMFAALVILVFSPTQLSEIGFQLSFIAVAAIISFAGHINPLSGSRNQIVRAVGNSMAMTSAAMLATGLLSALWFHTLPVLFLVSNIIVGPVIVPIILGGGIVVIAASLAGLPYGIAAGTVNWSVDMLQTITSYIAGLSWSSVQVWTLSGLTVGLVIITLWVIAVRLRRPESSRKLIWVASALAVFTIVSALTTGKTSGRDPRGTWYYLQSNDAVDIVIPISDTLFVVSDAPLSTHEARASTISHRLYEYMGRRNITEIVMVGEVFATDGLIRNRGRLLIGVDRIVLAGNGFIPGDGQFPTDVLILARGFNGNLKSTVSALRPSKIYLSPALNPKLRKRYISELKSIGADFVD